VLAAASNNQSVTAGNPAPRSLLEGEFPFAEVSELARRDRYCVDPVYAVHKWWARRPPAVIRALLLAAAMPAKTTAEDFWKVFSDGRDTLAGKVVGDPFAGGATSLVEASRLGADVTGIDVDPLAVRVARVELAQLDRGLFETEASALLQHLRERGDALYPSRSGVEALHYFRLREASCGNCGEHSLIYRNLWLARDRGLAGAVVREEGAVVFCPICDRLHHLGSDRQRLECCESRHRIEAGTYSRSGFECPSCGHTAGNEELRVGSLPSRLIAVEETVANGYRVIRAPRPSDVEAIKRAEGSVASTQLVDATLTDIDAGRPASYGFETVADLFHPRQKRVLSDAFAWIGTRDCDPAIRDALILAVSNALGSNNALCGYATDYGRLSSLFSAVRAYSMPVLSVELNPLHRSAGRGTLEATLRRVARSGSELVRRHTIDPESASAVPHKFHALRRGRSSVTCSSADRPLPTDFGRYDIALTDPPYFDFISYSDLSLLYRAWLAPESQAEKLGGAPIYPVGENPADEFATRLAAAFRNLRKVLKPAAQMIFTFHSPHEEAWRAVEKAIRRAEFRVHAVFPVWADGRGGSHGHAGNCEWDLVFVCRGMHTSGESIKATSEEWIARLGDEALEASDVQNLKLGLAMARRLSV
jgi:putative DNA methylase